MPNNGKLPPTSQRIKIQQPDSKDKTTKLGLLPAPLMHRHKLRFFEASCFQIDTNSVSLKRPAFFRESHLCSRRQEGAALTRCRLHCGYPWSVSPSTVEGGAELERDRREDLGCFPVLS